MYHSFLHQTCLIFGCIPTMEQKSERYLEALRTDHQNCRFLFATTETLEHTRVFGSLLRQVTLVRPK